MIEFIFGDGPSGLLHIYLITGGWSIIKDELYDDNVVNLADTLDLDDDDIETLSRIVNQNSDSGKLFLVPTIPEASRRYGLSPCYTHDGKISVEQLVCSRTPINRTSWRDDYERWE